MPYPEMMIRPMREELTRLGVEELKTPEQVDKTLTQSEGTVMVVVNSICGCAAGKARPGIAMALQHDVRPDKVATVFAGADIEATEKRASISGLSPVFAVHCDHENGEVVYMMERHQIEGNGPSKSPKH
jgi:putative YphP/YqiW family bacilliredoxin